MRPRKALSTANRDELGALLRQSDSAEEFRRIQCVWLRAALGLTVSQIALATGLAPTTVRCYHSRYLLYGANALKAHQRGGRRHQHLSPDQERQLLKPFLEFAAAGGVLEVGKIQLAYQELVGRGVPRSTVYRLLARHGWSCSRRPLGRMAGISASAR